MSFWGVFYTLVRKASVYFPSRFLARYNDVIMWKKRHFLKLISDSIFPLEETTRRWSIRFCVSLLGIISITMNRLNILGLPFVSLWSENVCLWYSSKFLHKTLSFVSLSVLFTCVICVLLGARACLLVHSFPHFFLHLFASSFVHSFVCSFSSLLACFLACFAWFYFR